MLPGTPASFPIAPERLVELAKHALLEADSGVNDDSVLAEDFRSAPPRLPALLPPSLPRVSPLPSLGAAALTASIRELLLLQRFWQHHATLKASQVPFGCRFEFPIVSLDRAAYLKTVRAFRLKEGIPNLSPNA